MERDCASTFLVFGRASSRCFRFFMGRGGGSFSMYALKLAIFCSVHTTYPLSLSKVSSLAQGALGAHLFLLM